DRGPHGGKAGAGGFLQAPVPDVDGAQRDQWKEENEKALDAVIVLAGRSAVPAAHPGAAGEEDRSVNQGSPGHGSPQVSSSALPVTTQTVSQTEEPIQRAPRPPPSTPLTQDEPPCTRFTG